MGVIYAYGKPEAATVGDIRRHVLVRDHLCILRLRDPSHRCVGKWAGRDAERANSEDWTLEHVPRVHSALDGRRDDDAHCVGLCHGTNVKPPTHDEREIMRDHLRALYPECPG